MQSYEPFELLVGPRNPNGFPVTITDAPGGDASETFQQGEEIVYVIDVAAENFGSQTGCGIPGRTVVLHLNSFTTSVLWDYTRMHYHQIGFRPIYLPLVTR